MWTCYQSMHKKVRKRIEIAFLLCFEKTFFGFASFACSQVNWSRFLCSSFAPFFQTVINCALMRRLQIIMKQRRLPKSKKHRETLKTLQLLSPFCLSQMSSKAVSCIFITWKPRDNLSTDIAIKYSFTSIGSRRRIERLFIRQGAAFYMRL